MLIKKELISQEEKYAIEDLIVSKDISIIQKQLKILLMKMDGYTQVILDAFCLMVQLRL